MIFEQIHFDQEEWYCVFQSKDASTLLLYVTLDGPDFPKSIAMLLTDEEASMFHREREEFHFLVRAFRRTHNSEAFSPRKVSFRDLKPDLIEVL